MQRKISVNIDVRMVLICHCNHGLVRDIRVQHKSVKSFVRINWHHGNLKSAVYFTIICKLHTVHPMLSVTFIANCVHLSQELLVKCLLKFTRRITTYSVLGQNELSFGVVNGWYRAQL